MLSDGCLQDDEDSEDVDLGSDDDEAGADSDDHGDDDEEPASKRAKVSQGFLPEKS